MTALRASAGFVNETNGEHLHAGRLDDAAGRREEHLHAGRLAVAREASAQLATALLAPGSLNVLATALSATTPTPPPAMTTAAAAAAAAAAAYAAMSDGRPRAPVLPSRLCTPASTGTTKRIGASADTSAAAMFAARGVPVYDADAAVHRVYAPGGDAVAPLEAEFPGVTGPNGAIDRAKLGELVFSSPDDRKRLESLVHPWIERHREQLFASPPAYTQPPVVLVLFGPSTSLLARLAALVWAPQVGAWHVHRRFRADFTIEWALSLPLFCACPGSDEMLDAIGSRLGWFGRPVFGLFVDETRKLMLERSRFQRDEEVQVYAQKAGLQPRKQGHLVHRAFTPDDQRIAKLRPVTSEGL
jgi:hypothetical protein